jgi:predicted nucleic acid-binding protein
MKRFHAEKGTDLVDRIADAIGTRILISALTLVELRTAAAIKVRTGQLTKTDALTLIDQFNDEILSGGMEVVPLMPQQIRRAQHLANAYGFSLRLRAGDAFQLAVALDLHQRGLMDCLVAADLILCEVAQHEGLLVVNPEDPTTLP